LTPTRILVVDDNEDNLELMRFLLSRGGYEPILAHGGAEAIELAARARPDLILMDIQMPGIDGYAATAAIRAREGAPPVTIVAVTAFAMVGDRDQVLAAGLDGYIAKPIAPMQFIAHVEEFLPPRLRASRDGVATS
jgi:CheY-like chemotaxis protein